MSFSKQYKIYCFHPLYHRFSKCSVRSPRAPREKPRGSTSYSFTYQNTDLDNFAIAKEAITPLIKFDNGSVEMWQHGSNWNVSLSISSRLVTKCFFVFIFRNLFWGSVNYGQSLQGLHNTKSLRTAALYQRIPALYWIPALCRCDNTCSMRLRYKPFLLELFCHFRIRQTICDNNFKLSWQICTIFARMPKEVQSLLSKVRTLSRYPLGSLFA